MKEVTRYFYVFLMLFFGLGCDQPTTRLPLPQVLYGSVYIKCERPPHLLNLDHLIATCTSEESLAALESSQQIIGCTMEEGSVDPEDADFSLDRVEGGYRVVSLRPEVEVLSAPDQPTEELTVDYSSVFYVSKGDRILRFYLRNQFVGGCPHDELFWQDY